MKVYLAAPFFTAEQLATVERLEEVLASLPLEVYSPRRDGVLMNMSREEKKKSTKKIFDLNCHHISESDVVLAVIDDKDTGTVWELGYASCRKHEYLLPKIVTYTEKGYGLNVMIQECVDSHVRGVEQARELFTRLTSSQNVVDYRTVCSDYRSFNENVT